MGGDRDGNPYVTPATTRDVVITARLAATNLYFKAVETLMYELSVWRCSDEARVRTLQILLLWRHTTHERSKSVCDSHLDQTAMRLEWSQRRLLVVAGNIQLPVQHPHRPKLALEACRSSQWRTRLTYPNQQARAECKLVACLNAGDGAAHRRAADAGRAPHCGGAQAQELRRVLERAVRHGALPRHPVGGPRPAVPHPVSAPHPDCLLVVLTMNLSNEAHEMTILGLEVSKLLMHKVLSGAPCCLP